MRGETFFCNLCSPPARLPIEDAAEHFDREHDVDLAAMMREASWPDGGAVIIDKTLSPEDFT
jgi:hypothetical protein